MDSRVKPAHDGEYVARLYPRFKFQTAKRFFLIPPPCGEGRSQSAWRLHEANLTQPRKAEPASYLAYIIVKDNGVGLDQENFDAFLTLDTSAKIKIGGKGIGRLSITARSLVTLASEMRFSLKSLVSNQISLLRSYLSPPYRKRSFYTILMSSKVSAPLCLISRLPMTKHYLSP